ncbi:enoyl-CoA hydratase-related protein [Polycladidibacter hongkongensis]|uniref:enoyl-CoA hydratase-related protein n=1 Tax=Polycladidibacter hongkongensis TaxID=1647556 RepID=UPI00082E535E|nr:enoyl-CoA hydratase-related protein [Pseudovibrio hongkongensis]
MSFETLQVERADNGITQVTLNRPDKRNAINAQMMDELVQLFTELAAEETTRVVVLTGSGRTFCSGGDLQWMQLQARNDRNVKIAEAKRLADMLQVLDSFPKPLIGRVNGPAFGGGVGLLCVCDIVVANDESRFALTETKLGLIPATIGPYVVRRIGEGNARQMFMSGKSLSAQDALRMGIVSYTVNIRQLRDKVLEEAEAFLKCMPGAVSEAKALCQHLARSPFEGQVEHTLEKLADRWESEEAQKAITQFFARLAVKDEETQKQVVQDAPE